MYFQGIDFPPHPVIRCGKHFGGGKDVTHKADAQECEESNPYLLCRICLEGEKEDMKYADVCLCTKTMPLHADCLMEWIKSKINKKTTQHFEFYSWKF